ncbi:hypothetical protein [Caldiplasma sukawensis]
MKIFPTENFSPEKLNIIAYELKGELVNGVLYLNRKYEYEEVFNHLNKILSIESFLMLNIYYYEDSYYSDLIFNSKDNNKFSKIFFENQMYNELEIVTLTNYEFSNWVDEVFTKYLEKNTRIINISYDDFHTNDNKNLTILKAAPLSQFKAIRIDYDEDLINFKILDEPSSFALSFLTSLKNLDVWPFSVMEFNENKMQNLRLRIMDVDLNRTIMALKTVKSSFKENKVIINEIR